MPVIDTRKSGRAGKARDADALPARTILTPDEAVQQSEIHLDALRWQVNEVRLGGIWLGALVVTGVLLISIQLERLHIQARRIADASAPRAVEAAERGSANR